MGKESSPPPKMHLPEERKKSLMSVLSVIGLCSLFYMLGTWQSSSLKPLESSSVLSIAGSPECIHSLAHTGNAKLDFEAHHSPSSAVDENDNADTQSTFAACDNKYSEYTPCEDPQRSLKFERERLIYRERHCPAKDERLRCLIPAPSGYKRPFPWPKSRDVSWYANVPHKELTVEKAIQNWIRYDRGKFWFPGGGTMFPKGANAYIDDVNKLIPLSGGSIRTALDAGCGVASWGAYLLDHNILTMSFAPRDTHEAQVQFALERGVPAMLGIMASKRLPYPARAFDMAHCSRCLIPWKDYDGVYLLEVDRVLRPGGYWVLSGPPINWQTHWKGWQRTKEDLQDEQNAIEYLARSICWKKVVQKGNFAIWQKPSNHIDCIKKRRIFMKPPMCQSGEPDSAWYNDMETCITPLPEASDRKEVAGGALANWPERLTVVPPRISHSTLPGITLSSFNENSKLWNDRVTYYKNSLVPPLGEGRYRNVMDMNAGLGGFAAALVSDAVWVMNTVPSHVQPNTLGVIYERGLIGTYQDWCEAFSTYPRTYDLIHADGIFSMYQDRCDIVDLLIEMDRILRPSGVVIARDDVDILIKVAKIASSMKWETRLADHESGPLNSQKILIAVKTYWMGTPANSTSIR